MGSDDVDASQDDVGGQVLAGRGAGVSEYDDTAAVRHDLKCRCEDVGVPGCVDDVLRPVTPASSEHLLVVADVRLDCDGRTAAFRELEA